MTKLAPVATWTPGPEHKTETQWRTEGFKPVKGEMPRYCISTALWYYTNNQVNLGK